MAADLVLLDAELRLLGDPSLRQSGLSTDDRKKIAEQTIEKLGSSWVLRARTEA